MAGQSNHCIESVYAHDLSICGECILAKCEDFRGLRVIKIVGRLANFGSHSILKRNVTHRVREQYHEDKTGNHRTQIDPSCQIEKIESENGQDEHHRSIRERTDDFPPRINADENGYSQIYRNYGRCATNCEPKPVAGGDRVHLR